MHSVDKLKEIQNSQKQNPHAIYVGRVFFPITNIIMFRPYQKVTL